MMKLMKYEWKRNANTLLSVFFVLVVAQLAVAIVGHYQNWLEPAIVALDIMMYLAAAVIMIVTVCKTFSYNIRAYHRRLLPVHPVLTILAPLLLSWIVLIVLMGIIAIHGRLYIQFLGYPLELGQLLGFLSSSDWLLVVGQIAWLYTLLILMVFVSMVIGASVSIRGKAGAWVSILMFIIIQYAISWLENFIFEDLVSSSFMFGVFEAESGSVTIEAGGFNFLTWGPFLLELGFAGVFIWLMSYLLERRVEI